MTSLLSTVQFCQQMSCLTTMGVGKQVEEVDVQRHRYTQASVDGLGSSEASCRLPLCSVKKGTLHWQEPTAMKPACNACSLKSGNYEVGYHWFIIVSLNYDIAQWFSMVNVMRWHNQQLLAVRSELLHWSEIGCVSVSIWHCLCVSVTLCMCLCVCVCVCLHWYSCEAGTWCCEVVGSCKVRFSTFSQLDKNAYVCVCVCLSAGRVLTEREKVSAQIISNWFANKRKELKKLAREGP